MELKSLSQKTLLGAAIATMSITAMVTSTLPALALPKANPPEGTPGLPTATPTPTPTATPTGTPLPPTPCPPNTVLQGDTCATCQDFALSQRWAANAPRIKGNAGMPLNLYSLLGTNTIFNNWLINILDQALQSPACQSYISRNEMNWIDDCTNTYLYQTLFAMNRNAFVPFDQSTDGWLSTSEYRDSAWHFYRPKDRYTNLYYVNTWIQSEATDRFYFSIVNGEVTLLEDRGANVMCDAAIIDLAGSPISLIWEDGYDINSEVTITSFPVHPGRAGKPQTWKASGKAPLLVYDPTHSGKITSASQLFGEWTFGGSKSASVAPPTGRPWHDGYEALASMDSNGDGEISGASELAPLALWFDLNRDGKSQNGEVRPLATVGVTRLFFAIDRSTKRSARDLHLTKGFERTEAGKTISGKSVDWYSDNANSMNELLERMSSTKHTDTLEEKLEPGVLKQATSNDFNTNIEGVWRWTFIRDGNKEIGGHFIFSKSAADEMRGKTLTMVTFEKPLGESQAMLTSQTFNVERDGNSNDSGHFTIVRSDENSLQTNFRIAPDGKHLTGKTSAVTTMNGEKLKLFYDWEAEKMIGK